MSVSWDDTMFESESLAMDTTVSDDIWKKFELESPLDQYAHRYQNELHDEMAQASSLPTYYEVPPMFQFDKFNCQASREIRHHDCMWAGLCISKEHNRTHPAKKDNQIHRRIPAGRSLLIPKNQNLQQQSQAQHCNGSSNLQSHSLTSSNVHSHNSMATNSNGYHQSNCRTMTKNLESDGDSTRPETPQSSESETESEEEEEEEEDEAPVFRHEQINIDDIVSMPVSSPGEVTNQSLRPLADRRKAEQIIAQEKTSQESVIRNTLMSDHCYHLNQQPASNKKLDSLGVQTPSDSEEEIDVVSYDKPTRNTSTVVASSLPTYPSHAEKKRFQCTVNTAFKPERNHSNSNSSISSTTSSIPAVTAPAPAPVTTPRPRGRPPTNPATRKRQLENAAAAATKTTKASSAKKAKQPRVYQKRSPPQKQAKSSPLSSPAKTNNSSSLASSSRSSSDDEPDIEKRSLHNNMERQRRIELRNAFEDLRRLVPAIEDKEKAPKVAILRQAAAYCYLLFDADSMNEAKVDELKRKQEKLRAQLSLLRRNLAMQR